MRVPSFNLPAESKLFIVGNSRLLDEPSNKNALRCACSRKLPSE